MVYENLNLLEGLWQGDSLPIWLTADSNANFSSAGNLKQVSRSMHYLHPAASAIRLGFLFVFHPIFAAAYYVKGAVIEKGKGRRVHYVTG